MKMTMSVVVAVVVTGLFIVTATPALAQSCDQLWVERNEIYKDAGYCFKTRRAIRYFGNDGCSYDSEAAVPLSGRERARVNRIIRLERENGCR